MITVQINGLKETRNYLKRLPKKIDKELKTNMMNELAFNLQRRMKKRAPVGQTGWLRRSIMIEKPTPGKRNVVIHAFYAMAVEKGRSNDMIIPFQFITQHNTAPEYPGHKVSKPNWINLMGSPASRPRPFIAPAVQSLRNDLPNVSNRFIRRALKK